MGSKLVFIHLALTKAKTARDTILQGFFYYYLLSNNRQLNSNATCEKYLQFNQERCSTLS